MGRSKKGLCSLCPEILNIRESLQPEYGDGDSVLLPHMGGLPD